MWRAKFTDGFVIDEFGGNGYTRLFKEVLDRQDKLEQLEVYLNNGDVFGIDITKGLFSVTKDNQSTIKFYGLPQDTQTQEMLTDIRVIYFVRGRVDMNLAKLTTVTETVEFYALGFQGNTKDGKNVQRYLAIQPTGVFDIRD